MLSFQRNKSQPGRGGPRDDAQREVVRALLYFLKAFALELPGLPTADFRKSLDDLWALASNGGLPELARRLEREKKPILDFISRQEECLKERERELYGIIDLVSDNLRTMSVENRAFTEDMQERNRQMEQAARLEDLRRLREAVLREVVRTRQALEQKQKQDSSRLQELSQEIERLSVDLERAQDASLRDPLTGVANREAFDRELKARLERMRVTGDPFALLMVDIDDFKPINDTYGHPVGDRVLIAVARKCRSLVRHEDLVARYGGEEFAIVLNRVSLGHALKRARSLVRSISARPYQIPERDEKLRLAMSVGVALATREDTPEGLVDRADRALYAAKRLGKNRAVDERSAPPPPPNRSARSILDV